MMTALLEGSSFDRAALVAEKIVTLGAIRLLATAFRNYP